MGNFWETWLRLHGQNSSTEQKPKLYVLLLLSVMIDFVYRKTSTITHPRLQHAPPVRIFVIMQKLIDLCITRTMTFDRDRRVSDRVLHCLAQIALT